MSAPFALEAPAERFCPLCGNVMVGAPDVHAIVSERLQGAIARRLVGRLAQQFGQWVPSQAVAAAAWPSDPIDKNRSANISTSFSLARPRLLKFGLVIDSRRCQGYRLRWGRARHKGAA